MLYIHQSHLANIGEERGLFSHNFELVGPGIVKKSVRQEEKNLNKNLLLVPFSYLAYLNFVGGDCSCSFQGKLVD